MKLLVIGLALVMGLAAQTPPATRNVILSWTPSTSTGVTGYNIYRCTVPCTLSIPLPAGQLPLNGIAPSPLTTGYTDFQVTVGNTFTYAATAVAPACTATTPANTPCGESILSNTVTIAIEPKPAPPTAPTATVQ